MRKTLTYHGPLNVLELKAYVDSDGLYNEEKYPKSKYEGRNDVVKTKSRPIYSEVWKVVKVMFKSRHYCTQFATKFTLRVI